MAAGHFAGELDGNGRGDSADMARLVVCDELPAAGAYAALIEIEIEASLLGSVNGTVGVGDLAVC
jgi:hypothetical protein